MVFTVNVEGERTIFLGDATDVVAKILVSDYGSYLKSDILQLAHHGKRNYSGMQMANTENLYKLIRPEIVLWPTSNVNYLAEGDETEVVSKHPWNLVALESARECFLAGEGITVLELPYTVFSAYKFNPEAPHTPVCADQPSSGDSLQYLPVVGDTLIDQVDW